MKRFKSLFTTIGLGALLCGACCALPLLGSSAVIGLAYLRGGIEYLFLAGLGIAGLIVWTLRRRKTPPTSCKTSCQPGCQCSTRSKKSGTNPKVSALS